MPPLFGNLVSPSQFAQGLDHATGVFFIFSNLCIRMEGSFRLQFTLVDLQLPKVLASAMSDIFVSHSWRTFPGMTKITPLTQHFVDQGVVKIVRKAQIRKEEAMKQEPYDEIGSYEGGAPYSFHTYEEDDKKM
ncbi:velvet factor-domain-containing protein [Polychytrium aggregatum]|uniref:velvet factor-domain-containing protein n=1 Tax=Polychytrium aggregatum TaxID=110093 RepID=UPI0022FE26EB|nr:velvet factor-domain-containing protein [Polychytrium aggregatum]KAI9201876.1 velvet factor-domain-containing protein [Polychytrium aggregatum]